MQDQNVGDIQEKDGVLEEKEKDVVSYKSYDKAVKEAKSYKEKFRELDSKLKEIQESEMKKNNEWKSLAESKDAALKEALTKLQEKEEREITARKIKSFEKHLGGKVKNPKYYSFVDFDRIAFNPDTEEIDEDSVKQQVSVFLREHAGLVETKTARLPNEAPKSATFTGKKLEEMTVEEMMKLGDALGKAGRIK